HGMPCSGSVGPAELAVAPRDVRRRRATYLFVDFHGLGDTRAFAAALERCPGSPAVLGGESVRFAAERFRPQQTKRLGPGLLAAEVMIRADQLAAFLPAAERLAAGAGVALEREVYFLKDGGALVIAGYLADHRRGSFAVDLTLAPAIAALAMERFDGRPYVLGRWQAGFFERAAGGQASRIRATRAALDPDELVNRGVLTGLRLRGSLGAMLTRTFVPGIGLLRRVYGSPFTARLPYLPPALLPLCPGPAAGRGAPADVGAGYAASPPPDAAPPRAQGRAGGTAAAGGEPESILLAIRPGTNGAAASDAATSRRSPTTRALHCVNCGE